MKDVRFVLDKRIIYAALKVVAPAIQSRVTIPVMENVKIVLKDRKAQFIGSDFSTTIVNGGIECDFKGYFEFMVNFEVLNKVISSLPSAPISFLVTDKTLTLNGEFKINVEQGIDTYPRIPVLENPIDVEFTNEQYSAVITASKFVFNGKEPDAQALMLQNISIRADGGYLDVFATDRHKGFFHRTKLIDGNIDFWSKIAGDSKLPDISNMPRLSFSENRVKISFGETDIYSMLSPQKYPEYWNVFKKTTESNVVIDSKDLLDALGGANSLRAMGYSGGEYRIVQLDFSPNKVAVSYENVDFNESFNRVLNCTTDVDGSIKLNLSCLTTILKSIQHTEELKIFYNDHSRAMLLWDNNDEHFLIQPLVF